MRSIIDQALEQAGAGRAEKIQRVAGGSINESFYICTSDSEFFFKHHPNPPEGFFSMEAEGLRLMRETGTAAVPEVFAYSDKPRTPFLLMEWVDGAKTAVSAQKLGTDLADMHRTYGSSHGFESRTYIGILPQPNGLVTSWPEYFRDCRIAPQLNRGLNLGTISGKRHKSLDGVLSRLDNWLPAAPPPSLLHGDLWGGNWIAGQGGKPYLIDPSVLYGDRHFDLAFSELFGGFPPVFYEAYAEQYPIEDYYEEIKPLYQLFYLLVHLNLFGEAYGSQVDAVLHRYSGH